MCTHAFLLLNFLFFVSDFFIMASGNVDNFNMPQYLVLFIANFDNLNTKFIHIRSV